MVDIYNYNQRYENYKLQVGEWNTTAYNIELIRRFLKREVERLSPGKKVTTILCLKGMFNGAQLKPDRHHGGRMGKVKQLIRKDFKDLKADDFKDMDAELYASNLKPETHRFYNQIIKRLYYSEYLDSKDEDRQYIINRFQTKIKQHQLLKNPKFSRKVTSDELITPEEALKMISRATRPLEKGLIAVAFEGTKRPNEYLTAKIRDVRKTNDGFEITITPSKLDTGADDKGTLYLFNLKSYFGEFWNSHPFKDNPEAPLFYREDHGHVGELLGGAGANKIVKHLATICGINKRVSLYSFRRGGYTWKVLEGMNKATAGSDMGWKPGSSQEKCYLGIFDSDVVSERHKLAGIVKKDKKIKELKEKPCPWCHAVNPPSNEVCEECGKDLDLASILQRERAERESLKAELKTLYKVMGVFEKYKKDKRMVEVAHKLYKKTALK